MWSICPSLPAVRRHVLRAPEELRLAATIREVEVRSVAEAEELGMKGSPTVLVDGQDLFAAAGPSFACRL
jgi:hypothetical protein